MAMALVMLQPIHANAFMNAHHHSPKYVHRPLEDAVLNVTMNVAINTVQLNIQDP
ncbi:hypothetical protein Patl1_14210 [Pistacia atlantica]|uniref:Uncharacterized protein n=1 Tax=Pistacia atlantica TaxID=434234 RepID=A0ACC1AX23_9ROSI|nr:hypothetical protein Patl1_14210 [Pistacia atlantica]